MYSMVVAVCTDLRGHEAAAELPVRAQPAQRGARVRGARGLQRRGARRQRQQRVARGLHRRGQAACGPGAVGPYTYTSLLRRSLTSHQKIRCYCNVIIREYFKNTGILAEYSLHT